ncbi:MAG: hypothetical protein PWP27_1536 [Clostridiales bacterium]|jgi:hypothetical protein|nr:hypothetical protein [Clostridiales bacterium]MDK2933726.1 hypothetical protein [Clostridiales bacterium]
MSYQSDNITEQLQQLCIDLIKKLDNLRAEGRISEMEYIKHTQLKREFLKNICNMSHKE